MSISLWGVEELGGGVGGLWSRWGRWGRWDRWGWGRWGRWDRWGWGKRWYILTRRFVERIIVPKIQVDLD